MRPLVLTRDPLLLDDLARLAAGAGVQLEVRADGVAGLAAWAAAPMVVVGDDAITELAAVAPPRRPGVVIASRAPGPDVFQLALVLGAESVVELPAAESHLIALLADVEEEPCRSLVVGVVGGAGGAGASTVACALGQVAGWSSQALVIDTDPLGPGLDRLLGLDDTPGVRWPDLAASAGRLGSRSLREAVPRRDGVGVLTWTTGAATPPPLGTLRDVIAAARRGHALVVLDLARQTVALSLELMARCDLVLAVTPATVSGVASTGRLVAPLGDTSRWRLATRRGPVPTPDLVAAVGVPVVLEVPEQKGLTESVDLGLGTVRNRRTPLARTVTRFLAEVA